MKQTDRIIRNALRAHESEVDGLALQIHRNPELAYEEHRACAWQVALLRKWGFAVETPFCGLDTAFRATVGRGRPVFCLMSEYDALPELGHGCGHNLIAASALGAGVAVAAVLKEQRLPGTLVVMGTPAEESGGGKLALIRRGGLKGLDAVLMAHPSHQTTPDLGCTAVTHRRVVFTGRSAHAASCPERGRNALDAVLLLFQGVNAWRQHLPESARVHGIVTEGGDAPNIVPERAACDFFLRSPDDSVLAQMTARFTAIARGAALMTGTRVRVSAYGIPHKGRKPNGPLNAEFIRWAAPLGLDPVFPELPTRGSSDFGDVSHARPGAHVYFAISRKEVPGHSRALCQAAGSAFGRRQMLRAAEALAHVGSRFFADAGFRADVQADFLRKRT
jgi:amidohydrolase